MLTPQGQIKLVHFGIARLFNPTKAGDTLVMGTPGYAPPEQYGKSQTDVCCGHLQPGRHIARSADML